MNTMAVKIIGSHSDVFAIAQVSQRGDVFSGTIDLSSMPMAIRQTFQEFEEIVNGQMFSLLDEVQDRIENLLLRVRFDEGTDVALADLQVYPSTRRVSFKLAASPFRPTAHA